MINFESQMKAANSQIDATMSELETTEIQLKKASEQVESAREHLETATAQMYVTDRPSVEAAINALGRAMARFSAATKMMTVLKSQLDLAKSRLDLGLLIISDEKSQLAAEKAALQIKVSCLELEKTKLQESNRVLEAKLSIAIKGNPKVFFDLSLRGAPARRVVFELFADTKPYKAEIFRALCTGEKGFSSSGIRLHYKGTDINYVFYNRVMAGGNIARGNASDAVSIYGDMEAGGENMFTGPGDLTLFLDEEYYTKHSFLITLMMNPSNYGRETVIGKVIEGMDVVNAINDAFPNQVLHIPENIVLIANCGELLT